MTPLEAKLKTMGATPDNRAKISVLVASLDNSLDPSRDFQNQNLQCIDFEATDLTGYDFTRSNLSFCDFSKTTNIAKATFDLTIQTHIIPPQIVRPPPHQRPRFIR